MTTMNESVLYPQMHQFGDPEDSLNGSLYFSTYPTLIEKELTKEQILDRMKIISINQPWIAILSILYAVLILMGTVGNILVVTVVVRKSIMRTARNIFILNLAISDLLLCVVTMPLTLIEILSKFWPFGTCELLCKIISMLQATSIFVSTLSITAIALDRYQVIVYPTRENLQLIGATIILICIWLVSIAMASPLFIYKKLEVVEMPPILANLGLEYVGFCVEKWPVPEGRVYFSIFALCLQYLVPIIIVSGAYIRIYYKLKNRIPVLNVQAAQRSDHRERRMKRTNILLISIAAIFGFCWLPINFFNLYADMRQTEKTENLLLVYAFCHMIAMFSACANPLLYGYLNENFRKEFKDLLCCSRNTNNVNLNGTNLGGSNRSNRRRFWHFLRRSKRSGKQGNIGTSQADTRLMDQGPYDHPRTTIQTESIAITDNKFSTEITTLVG
ncbi:NPY1R family protein [Megaselia abdita]